MNQFLKSLCVFLLASTSLLGCRLKENETSVASFQTEAQPPEPANGAMPQPMQPPEGALPREKNITLKKADGTEVTLNRLMGDKQKMIVEFSWSRCAPCIALARQVNTEGSQVKSNFESPQCAAVVILARNDLNPWLRSVGAESFVGTHSYEGLDPSIVNLGATLGIAFNGVPTVAVIDRQGRRLAQASGTVPRELATLCPPAPPAKN